MQGWRGSASKVSLGSQGRCSLGSLKAFGGGSSSTKQHWKKICLAEDISLDFGPRPALWAGLVTPPRRAGCSEQGGSDTHPSVSRAAISPVSECGAGDPCRSVSPHER